MRGGDRPRDAWAAILELHRDSEPVRVTTEWAIYPEMVISRCEAHDAGRGMRFEMELSEILRVSAAMGPVVPSAAMTGNAAGRSGQVSRGRVPLETVQQEVLRRFGVRL